MEIKLPDWVSKTDTLMILSGQELIAFKEYGKPWKIKEKRCDQCGECCMALSPDFTPFGADDEGKCNALKKDGERWICTAGANKPFRCLSDPVNIEELGCCIRY